MSEIERITQKQKEAARRDTSPEETEQMLMRRWRIRIARLITRSLLLLAVVAFVCGLFLPCQRVNIRGGWSLGLEAAPWFRTVHVFGIGSLWAILVLLLMVVSLVPFRRAYLALPALGLYLGTMAYYTGRVWFWGDFVRGRADEVLYGYYVHRGICCAALVAGGLVLLVDLFHYATIRRKRRLSLRSTS
jgi:hypothetical protein